MHPRLRKFIGTIAILLLVIIYALAVMMLAQPVLKEANRWVELLYYIVGGICWIFPVMGIIRWMERSK